jgi:hypothetical protein
MEKYDYKVDYLAAQVMTSDVQKKVAEQKVAAQLEIKLREWAEKGYEYCNECTISVDEVSQYN